MRTPPQILVVDDNATNIDIIKTRLAQHGYELYSGSDGLEAVDLARSRHPDLILLDVMMPNMDGMEACKLIKADESIPFVPIIMVTAKADSKDVVAGLDAGADEYLTKPIDHAALVARVKSMLRFKTLHDERQEQASRLEIQSTELTELNRTLEQRVEEQLEELNRVGQLKRFLSPQLVDIVLSSGDEQFMKTHRREITVVFCDIRGFTPFSETAEPEEVMRVLREYHGALGPLINEYQATLEHFAGDGLAVYFNDPFPQHDPALRAVRMSLDMRDQVSELSRVWRKRGYHLDFGVGVALGYATLGEIGFEGRFHYGAIGSVLNLASRLCDEAKGGQILIAQRVYAELEDEISVEPVGEISLKGFHKPIPAFNVVDLSSSAMSTDHFE